MPVQVEDIIPAEGAPQQKAEAPQQEAEAPQQEAEAPQQEAPKRRGKPPGSKNKPKPPPAEDVQEDIEELAELPRPSRSQRQSPKQRRPPSQCA